MVSLLAIKRRAEAMPFEDESYEGLDLRSMKAFGAKFIKCSFTETPLDLSDVRSTRFDGCTFLRCSIQRVDFSASVLEGCAFEDCDLEQSSFMGAHLNDVTFLNCRMAYGDTMFQGATVKRGVSFTKCNLHGSNLDFRVAEPGGLSFDDCQLWGAKAALGCAFWNAHFDEKACQRFVAMLARIYPSNDMRVRLMEIAGVEYKVVNRAMNIGKEP